MVVDGEVQFEIDGRVHRPSRGEELFIPARAAPVKTFAVVVMAWPLAARARTSAWRQASRAEVGDEHAHLVGGIVHLDALDDGAEQHPAILGGEHIPDLVEVGEASRDP